MNRQIVLIFLNFVHVHNEIFITCNLASCSPYMPSSPTSCIYLFCFLKNSLSPVSAVHIYMGMGPPLQHEKPSSSHILYCRPQQLSNVSSVRKLLRGFAWRSFVGLILWSKSCATAAMSRRLVCSNPQPAPQLLHSFYLLFQDAALT